ncbi:hypothetical protein BJY04DRAFT_193032 [Aspergillus karnatakaensis]|uniref:uncharacterized protein n=1 Tax=Aspergillus karnatakaensis TaxID=1810916 RepID=UPI003CCDDAAC
MLRNQARRNTWLARFSLVLLLTTAVLLCAYSSLSQETPMNTIGLGLLDCCSFSQCSLSFILEIPP